MARVIAIGIDPTRAESGGRVVKRNLKEIGTEAGRTERAVDRNSDSFRRYTRVSNDGYRSMSMGARSYSAVLGAATRAAVGFGAALAAAFSVRPLFAFQDAIAEVSTLVDTARFDMEGLTEAALRQNATYGGGAAAQAKSFYQIISAGASSAAEANDILTASNRLAVGGVTEVGVAADGLTSVLNAYGSQVEGATAVSDALFVGMRAGKTTIQELSTTLGRVAPLAAQTGVSFDQLVASVAALTKGGISTAESVTGVRAILAAVAKPTSEATKLAEALGLEFNSTALRAQGLAGFLEELIEKTGGNTDALAQLFGGVEALVPVLALSGQAGEDFTAILDDMASKAGSTQEAFDKMAASPGFQIRRLWGATQTAVIRLAEGMGRVLLPAISGLATAMEALGNNVETLGVVLGSLLVARLGLLVTASISAVASLGTLNVTIIATTAAMRAATIASTALSAALAVFGGPIGLAIAALAGTFYYLATSQSQAEKAAQTHKEALDRLNTAIAQTNLANEAAVNSTRALIMADIEGAQKALDHAKARLALRAATFEEAGGGAAGMMGAAVADAAGGPANIRAEIERQQAHIRELRRELKEFDLSVEQYKAPEIGTADSDRVQSILDGLGDSAEKAKRSYQDLIQSGREFITEQEMERRALGMTEEAANALRYEQDLLNQAKRDDIALSPAQADGIRALAQEMAAAEAQTTRLRENMEFAKGITRGFIQDVVSGVRQGESVWKSFGDAALGALDKITNKLLDDVLDAVFRVNQSLSGIGGGGGSFLGMLGSLLGIGGGGVTSFASGIQSGAYVGLFHNGRWPGQPGGTRLADPSWFAGAPRYHNGRIPGLAADEEPAILRRSEPVFRSMDHARQVVGQQSGGGETVVRVELSEGLRSEILAEAEGSTVRIVERNNKARRKLWQSGGEPR